MFTFKRLFLALAILVVVVMIAIVVRTYYRYQVAEVMDVPVTEFTNAEYPEDPAGRSEWLTEYQGRRLKLVRKDDTHFDFVFEPLHDQVAKVIVKDVDVSLMTPSLPEWTKEDPGLERIALTDREWNRQQVYFGGPEDGHVEVSGGNGWEVENLYSVALAKNCLNAGLWELILTVEQDGQKKMYYQGWFTFPLGLYKEIFEHNTGLAYSKHWYYLEHWFDPAGMAMHLDTLREVEQEWVPLAKFDPDEPLMIAGEQVRKRRTTVAENIRTWGDFYKPQEVRYASFIPPGRYSVDHPWENEYQRLEKFEKAVLRKVRTPASDELRDELELMFSSSKHPGKVRFLVGGIDIESIPQLSTDDYPKGLYMPMGIGVPPFYQDYTALTEDPPSKTGYFSLLLDEQDRWIDHHSFAIDGPVIHRDETDPNLIHLYLLSYERHSLIGHWVIDVSGPSEADATENAISSVSK